MRLRSLLVVTSLPLASLATAADQKVESLLARMRAAYKAVQSAQLNTVSELTMRNGTKATINATVNYSRTNKIHVSVLGYPSVAKGSKVVVYTDGKTIKTIGFPGGHGEYKYSHQAVVSSLPVNLESLCFWDYERQLSTKPRANMSQSKLKIVENQKWDGRTWTVLEESAGQSFIRYYIDPKTALIHRSQVTNLEAKRVVADYKLTSLKLNAKVDPKLFVVVPSSASRISI